jgi:hypothetical protein
MPTRSRTQINYQETIRLFRRMEKSLNEIKPQPHIDETCAAVLLLLISTINQEDCTVMENLSFIDEEIIPRLKMGIRDGFGR